MARMDCYRITFIHFSGVEGDILLRLLTLSLHRVLALGHMTAVYTYAYSVTDKKFILRPLGRLDPPVRSIG